MDNQNDNENILAAIAVVGGLLGMGIVFTSFGVIEIADKNTIWFIMGVPFAEYPVAGLGIIMIFVAIVIAITTVIDYAKKKHKKPS